MRRRRREKAMQWIGNRIVREAREKQDTTTGCTLLLSKSATMIDCGVRRHADTHNNSIADPTHNFRSQTMLARSLNLHIYIY